MWSATILILDLIPCCEEHACLFRPAFIHVLPICSQETFLLSHVASVTWLSVSLCHLCNGEATLPPLVKYFDFYILWCGFSKTLVRQWVWLNNVQSFYTVFMLSTSTFEELKQAKSWPVESWSIRFQRESLIVDRDIWLFVAADRISSDISDVVTGIAIAFSHHNYLSSGVDAILQSAAA